MPEKFTDTPLLTERFDAALTYASAHHRRQLRKGSDIPYTAHLLAVAAIALEMGCDEDEAIGALLHDVVEDGGGPKALEEIRTRFGPAVADIVQANSDTDIEPKPPWRERKEAYIAAIAHKTPAAVRVSLADKLHNARSILQDYRHLGEDLWSRFKMGEGESIRWYYRALAVAFAQRSDDLGDGGRAALGELRRVLWELDREVARAWPPTQAQLDWRPAPGWPDTELTLEDLMDDEENVPEWLAPVDDPADPSSPVGAYLLAQIDLDGGGPAHSSASWIYAIPARDGTLRIVIKNYDGLEFDSPIDRFEQLPTLGEILHILDGGDGDDWGLGHATRVANDIHGDREELRGFLTISSSLYPDLGPLDEARFERWVRYADD